MLINLRNALMSGKRLPYDAEVEYLESTGTQWIDTGVKKVTTTTIDCLFSLTNTAVGAIFGARVSQSESGRCVLFNLGTSFRFDAFNQLSLNIAPNTTSIFRFRYDGSNATITDTTTGSVVSGAVNIGTDGVMDIALFANNTNGTIGNYLKGRIYSFKIWDNNTLVRDFIPVRKGTVGYLYDRVSRKLFGNQGTGDFVVGPDVVPVEYIESHGTEWIDTGVYGNESTHVTIVAASKAFTSSSDVTDNAEGIFGYAANYSLRAWGKSFHSTYGLLSFGFKQGWTNGSQIYAQSSDQYLTIELRPYGNTSCRMYIDDTASISSSYGGAFTTSGTLWLGKIGGGNTYNGVNMRIKSFSIEGKCNLVPIRVGSGSTWEGAMMDVLTRRIYRNAGTGAFTYGNDLKYPIPAE